VITLIVEKKVVLTQTSGNLDTGITIELIS
jgi:hypothetical protein